MVMMMKYWQLGAQRGIPRHASTLTVFLAAFLALANGSCKTNWTEWNQQYCYKVFGEKKTAWQTAEIRCQQEGGHLASLHSNEEMNFVSTFIKNSGLAGSPVWIGLNDVSTELDFRWSDYSVFDYFNWKTLPPKHDSADCVHTIPQQQLLWAVGACNIWYAYICKSTPDAGILHEKYTQRQLYTTVQNRVFKNHVLSVKRVSSLLHCSALCLREKNCKSFCYGNNRCYLNSATDKDFPHDLVEKTAFVYAVPIK